MDTYGSGKLNKRPQDQALFYCLRRAADLAEGSLQVARLRFANSLSALLRGLYETFLWTYWVTASEENAQKFAENFLHQLKKIAAKNRGLDAA